ncbi:Amino acid adenylation domain-containing protein [Sulfidibacter corallicola]|uniref:Amino acid adenylation domain-containing protein n=1 Tax=Sulfidibacter corallicola TaxID=2818388 RepID=A0A8A4THD5_SULCO|nr:non-ribosomal peptide synthetase [Sulfidibacter corallicola]QTD48917.1 amino acid adenylation domain-containing protein [Sulfidibacter corallicola]
MSRRYRLTEPQRGIYYGLQWQGEPQIYYILGISRIEGPLDPALMARAIDLVHHTQPALRLAIEDTDEGPRQRIRDAVKPDYAYIDLGSVDAETAERYLAGLLDEARRHEFRLDRDMPFRTRLIRLGPERFAWFLHVHHLICDAWGTSVIYNEVSRLYRELATDPNYTEPENLAFFDYIDFEAQYLESPRFESDRTYWREKIEGLEPFPLDRAFPRPKRGFSSRREERRLTQSPAIYAYCERHKVSVYTFFAALIGLHLHHISGLDRLALGVSVLNRPRKAHKGAVGMFSNFIPLILDLTESATFPELIAQVGAVSKRDFRHQRHPIHRILTALDMVEAQLLPVQFNYQNSLYDANFGHFAHDPVWYFSEAEEHVLTFNINDFQEGGIQFSLDYSTDVFDNIDLIWERMVSLIDQILDETQTCLTEYAPLPERERAQLMAFARGAEPAQSAPRHVVDQFLETTDRHAARAALAWSDGSWSYAELHARAARFANAMSARGVVAGDRIALRLPPGPEAVAAIWGIWLVRATYLPLDPAIPAQRLETIVAQAQPRLMIGGDLAINQGVATLAAAELEAQPIEVPVEPRSLEDDAYLIFTSGSTGTPKAVRNHHAALAHYTDVFSRYVDLEPSDRFGQQAALTFDTSLEEIVPVLLAGGTLFFLDRKELLDGAALWGTIEREKLTLLSTTPGVVGLLDEQAPDQTSLRVLISGGDALHPEHYANLTSKVRVLNSYGPTETTVCATYTDLGRDGHGLGRPLPGVSVYLVDSRRRLVPVTVTGEIAVAGRGVSRGYLGRPDLTEERFVPNPWARGEHDRVLYLTGDLGKWDESGRLHFAGRADRQLKLRGYRIEPGEIEAALEAHPDVRAAAVVAEVDGDGDAHLVGHLSGDRHPETETLRDHLAASLPEYMIPWRFVHYPTLPRNTAGKVDFRALRSTAEASVPRQVDPPATDTERDLADIWSQILDQPIDNRRTHFFQAGGHSLKATRLARAIERHWNVAMPLAHLFGNPNLHDQAALIDRAEPRTSLTIPLQDEADHYPISHAQERLWLLQSRTPEDTAYHIALVLDMRGPLDRNRLEAAMQWAIDRHDSPRARFVRQDGEPVQRISTDLRLSLGGGPLDAHKLDAALRRDVLTPFDLSRGPLVRSSLWQLGPEHGIWVLVFHHIAVDAWSVDLVLAEVVSHYGGQSKALSEPFQARHFAAWQRAPEGIAAYAAARDFWLQKARDLPRPLDLPIQGRRGTSPRPAALLTRRVDTALVTRLDAWAARHQATRFMALHAGLTLLLHHFCGGARDITIGSPIAGRDLPQLEHSVGFFANTLALRTQVDPAETADAFLSRLAREDLAAFDHAAYPFDLLVEALNPPHETGRTQLFDVMLVLLNTRDHHEGLNGIEARRLTAPVRHAKCDWLFSFREQGGELFLDFEYDTDLYTRARAESVADHYLNLLERLPRRGDVALRDLQRTRHLQSEAAAPTSCSYTNTAHRFETMVATHPYRIALETSDQVWTYGRLGNEVQALAEHLAGAHAVVPGDVVAVATRRPSERVIALLASLRLGAVFLPIDIEWPEPRRRFSLDDSGARLILADSHLDWAGSAAVVLPRHRAQRATSAPPPFAAAPRHPAYLLYTSGSTGRPKAVLQTHGCLDHLVDWQLASLPTCGRVLQFAAFTFDVFLQETLFALCGGSTLLLPDPAQRGDLAALRRLIDERTVSVAFLPYTALRHLCENAPDGWGHSLKHLITAGEALVLTDGLKQCLRRRPKLQLHNHYGPTETHVVTAFSLSASAAELPTLPPIGTPIAQTRAEVRDAHGQPLPDGATGELWIGGPGVADGYWNRPVLTAERFVPEEFAEGPRWYRTGDLVHRDESGAYHFHGRIDTQVKVRGFRVECGEIEHHLTDWPGVRDAVVVVNEADCELAAWLTGEAVPDEDALRGHLAARLPSYMVPAHIFAVTRLPMTHSGKVDRAALAGGKVDALPLGANGPDATAPTDEDSADRQNRSPHTATERLLADLWRRTLHLGDRPPAREDDFFAQGGHSISAGRLALALERDHGLQIELRWIFDHPRLCDLARHIDFHREAGTFSPIPPRPVEPTAPLSSAQMNIWLACQNPARSLAYHIPAVFHLRGPFNREAFERSFADLVVRHEGLRTRFITREGQPAQVVAPPFRPELTLLDAKPGEDPATHVQAFLEIPFDLERGPLLRAALIVDHHRSTRDAPCHLLAFVIHHLVADGWSLDLLVREWLTSYDARCLGHPNPLMPAALHYADFAVWERHRATGETGTDRDRTTTSNPTVPALFEPALELDANHPFTGQTDLFQWSPSTLAELYRLARHHDATPYAAFAGTLFAALHHWTGREDLSLGMPSAARIHPDTRDMIGVFVKTLPLRARLEPQDRFAELLAQVRGSLVRSLAHQDEKDSHIADGGRAAAPIQVVLVLQNTAEQDDPGFLVPGMEVTPEPIFPRTSRLDLSFNLREGAEGLEIQVEYDRRRFNPEDIALFMGRWHALATAAVADPDLTIAELPFQTPEEREQAVVLDVDFDF